MNIKELKKHIENLPDDMEIVIPYHYWWYERLCATEVEDIFLYNEIFELWIEDSRSSWDWTWEYQSISGISCTKKQKEKLTVKKALLFL